MAILDDFTINTTLRTIRHTSGTTVYSVNALYSAIKDFEDNAANMDDEIIMTAQTPTEYTITNGWFIDNPSTHYLNGGAITTSGYLNEIQRVVTTDAGTDPVPGDIGLQVNDGGDVGALLHYDLDINDDGTQVNAWYVRTGSGTALTGALTITTGTGAQTVSTSVDGEEIWTNVFSFGVLVGTVNPQFYIEQQLNGADHRVIEWVANSNFSRGNMDVLLRTQVEGTVIDNNGSGLSRMLITVRQPGTSYDSSEQSLNGGRNPFALNSADDDDNTGDEYYVLFTGETGTDIVVGDTITADAKAWYAEVSTVGYFDGTTGYLGLRGLNESIDTVADADAFTSSGTGTASISGTPGDRIIHVDAETGNFTVGLVVTDASGAKGVVRGIRDLGTDSYLVTEVNHDFRASGASVYYDAFTENDTITDTSTGAAVVDLATLNLQDGISGMDDIDIVFTHGSIGTSSNTLTAGMHVTVSAGPSTGATGTVVKVDGSTVYFGNTSADFASGDTIDDDDSAAQCVTNTSWTDLHLVPQNFQQASSFNYDAVIFLEGNTVSNGYQYGKFVTGDGSNYSFQKYNQDSGLIRTPVAGQFYLSAYFDIDTPSNTYDKVGKRAAPVGNFAGGIWFLARGFWLDDVAPADATNYRLLDSTNNILRTPPSFVTISQGNTVSGDRIFVVEDDGSGKTSKTTYNSHASNNTAGSTTFEVDGTPVIRTDTPTAPILRVVDDSSTSAQLKEHRYRVASWTGNIYTLATASTGTITVANAAGTILIDSTATFITDGVEPGDMVRNTTDGSISQVESVDSEIQLTTKILEGGTDNDYDAADSYEINTLAVSYVAADTAYTPYIDRLATGTTESVVVIYEANRNLIGKARNKGVIFAFVGTGVLNSSGATITTVRTTDTIAT